MGLTVNLSLAAWLGLVLKATCKNEVSEHRITVMKYCSYPTFETVALEKGHTELPYPEMPFALCLRTT